MGREAEANCQEAIKCFKIWLKRTETVRNRVFDMSAPDSAN
jgi:hypothetical protein